MMYLLLSWLAAPWLLWRAACRRGAAPRRVLVIQTAKIGDFVATTPVFRALRLRLPQAEIVALLHPLTIPLAAGLSSIDHIITLPPGGYRGWAGKRWLLAQLRGCDAVVVLSPNLATLLAPLWCGVPYRVAVLPDRRQGSARLAYPLLTYGEVHRPGQLLRTTALQALRGLGIAVDAALLAMPNEAPLGTASADRLPALLGGASRPWIGLGLGAGNRMKALAPGQFRDLALRLIERTPATLVLIGTAADQGAAAELLAELPVGRLVDSTGQWSLAELPTLLAALDCFVGVDSGATYLADALGVPVVDFMGPADAADQRPLGPRVVVIQSDEPCAPCSHAFDAPYRCRLGTRACITGVRGAMLADRVVDLLATGNKG